MCVRSLSLVQSRSCPLCQRRTQHKIPSAQRICTRLLRTASVLSVRPSPGYRSPAQANVTLAGCRMLDRTVAIMSY